MAKAIAKKQSGGLQKADWKEKLAGFAKSNPVEKGGESVSHMRIMDGEFMLGDDELPSTIETVVVNYSFLNAYYEEDWDPDHPAPPTCFAVGMDEDELAPHEDSPEPQADTCEECWANKFKSGKGKGKACGNTRRLALLDLDSVENGDPECHIFKVAPTGLKEWKRVNKKADAEFGIPIQGVVVEMSLDKHNHKRTAAFKVVEEVDDEFMFEAIVKQHDAMEDALLMPLQIEFEEEEEEGPPKKARKKTAAKKKVPSRKAKDEQEDEQEEEEEEETPQQRAAAKKRAARKRQMPTRRKV